MKIILRILIVFLSLFSITADAEFFQSEEVQIYYTDSKDGGDPILLVHGFSMSSSMWHESGIVKELAKNNRVITIDCRGHGKSGKPGTPEEYGPNVGKDIVNLLNHLDIEKAHLVGYSMGAYAVSRLLISNPERVKTAVLGSGFFPTDDKEELSFQEHIAKDMEEHGEVALAAVARGWKYDAVTDAQIATVSTPVQAVFGSKEIDNLFESQKYRLTLPTSSLPIVIIDGADHDSENAAVLHPKFVTVIKNISGSQ